MKPPIVQWLQNNALIPAAMVLITAVLASIYQVGETDARSYRSLIDAWQIAPPALKLDVKIALDDGRISRWEWRALFRRVMEENKVVVMKPDIVDRDAERTQLIQLAK